MTDVSPPQVPVRRAWPPVGTITTVGVFALLTLLGASLLRDPDTYWHVVAGETLLQQGSFPRVDTWSWSAFGEDWVAKEWLSQVLLAEARRLGGWAGVVVLGAAAAAAAFGLLARFLAARVSRRATVVLVGVAFMLASPHLLARPHVLALPLLVAWVIGLVEAVEARRAPDWWLLVLLVVWTNTHGSFLLGVGIAGALGLEAVLAANDDLRPDLLRRWAAFLGGALLATLATPYGPGVLLAALDVLALGPARQVIVEWLPPDFSTLTAIELALLAAIGLAVSRPIRIPWPRLLLLLGLVHLGLFAVRNGDVLGMVTPLLLAGPLTARVPRRNLEGLPPDDRRPLVARVTGAALIVVLAVVALSDEGLQPAPRFAPEDAVDALQSAGSQRVLNDYSFGGYLVERGVPTFIDGRAEFFGGPAVVAHDRAIRLSPPSSLDDLLATFEPDSTLLQPGTPALAFLDASDEWERVHADDLAVVHVRVP